MEISESQFSQIVGALATIEEGIKGIHRRQDITNGRVAKNEERVIDLEKTNISVSREISELKERNSKEDKSEERAADIRGNFYSRLGERVVWGLIVIVGVILTKLGIINFSLPVK